MVSRSAKMGNRQEDIDIRNDWPSYIVQVSVDASGAGVLQSRISFRKADAGYQQVVPLNDRSGRDADAQNSFPDSPYSLPIFGRSPTSGAT